MHKLPDFQHLRDQWALVSPPPSTDIMTTVYKMDRAANPHNDSYKPKIRSMEEIHSDLAYAYADAVLERQYGNDYTDWCISVGLVKQAKPNWNEPRRKSPSKPF